MNSGTAQLNGWKEIANHLGRSVRCVQRWGENENLPVRRHAHRRGVSVYAFQEELDAWWQEQRPSSTERPGKLRCSGNKKERGTVQGPAMRQEAPRTDSIEVGGHPTDQAEIEQMAREVAILFLGVLGMLPVRESFIARAKRVW